jgi:hypothetical protein
MCKRNIYVDTIPRGANPHKTIAYYCSLHIPIFLRIHGNMVLGFTPYDIKQPIMLVRGGFNLACWSSVFVMSSRECIELLRSSQ